MAKRASSVSLTADLGDPEDFGASEAGVAQAQAERASRRAGVGLRGSDEQPVSLRLDSAVIEHCLAGGPGWQTRTNEKLRKAAKQEERPNR